MCDMKHFKRVDRRGLRVASRENKQAIAQNRRRDDSWRIKNDLAVDVFAFWKKAVNEIHPIQPGRREFIKPVRPDLQIKDAVVLAVLVFRHNRAAIRRDFKQIVIFRQALEIDFVPLIVEVFCNRQATRNVAESQMVDD